MSLVSGFLGSGKTTLLNRILHQQHDRRIGVLVNDFGDVNIDAQLITRVEGETIALSNGCVCCTIRDDLVEAVTQMAGRDPAPDAIVIETSGVSEPNAAAMSLVMSTRLAACTRLDAIVTVVDAESVGLLSGADRHLAVDQVAVADIVIVNKADLVDDPSLQQAASWVREAAPRARILTARHCEVPLELVLGTALHDLDAAERTPAGDGQGDGHDHPGHHSHGAHADHGSTWSSLSWRDDRPLAFQAIYRAFAALPLDIFRAKGILFVAEAPDRRVILQMVGKRVMLSRGDAWGDTRPFSQVVLIGRAGCIDPPAIEAELGACRADTAHAEDNPFADAVVQVLRGG